MAAVCAMEHWSEVIAANPKSRDMLMAMDPQRFHRPHGRAGGRAFTPAPTTR